MTKDVLVSISGMQMGEQVGDEPIEVITPGTYYYKNNKHYVIFEEMMDGAEDVTKNTLWFSNDAASMKRTGAAYTEMIFNKKAKTLSNYSTPFGSLMIGIDTNTICCQESEEKIHLSIDYSLDINYQYMADCNLKVNITPAEAGIRLCEG